MPVEGSPYTGSIPTAGSQQTAVRVPTSLLPHSTSSLRQSLLAKRQAGPRVTASQPGGRLHVPRDHEQDAPTGDELTWSRNRVVWSRGGAVYRTFSYDQDGQEVVHALFADFNDDSTASDSDREPVASTSAVTLDSLSSTRYFESASGPYHSRNPTAWSDDPLPLPTEPPTGERPLQSTPQRHLVVIFPQTAFIYPATGGFVPVHCPFRIRRAWPLDVGILLERAADVPRRGGAPDGDKHGFSPILWSLSKALGEVKPVEMSGSGAPTEWRGLLATEVERMHDPNQETVFSSTGRQSVPPIVITGNAATGELVIWQYARQDPKLEEVGGWPNDEDAALAPISAVTGPLGPSVQTPSLKPHLPDNLPVTSSPMSRGPSSLSGTKRKHGVSFVDPEAPSAREERSIRRSSAHGGLNGLDNRRPRVSLVRGPLDPEEEMLDALALHSEPPGMTASRASQAPPRWPHQGDRRTSLTRNDLSVTMDRMALSQSGVPFALANDLAHEATILGEAGEAGPPAWELSMTAIWSAKLGTTSEITSAPTVHIFDVRGSKSILAIEVPTERQLYLLEARTEESGAVSIEPLKQIPAVASATVRLARGPVKDLLVLKPDGTLVLLGADGAEYSSAPYARDLLALADTLVPNALRAALTTQLHGQQLGCVDQMATAQNRSAVRRCLEALAQILPSETFDRVRNELEQSDVAAVSTQRLESALVNHTSDLPIRAIVLQSPAPTRLGAFNQASMFGDKQLRQVLRARPKLPHTAQPPSPLSHPEGRVFEAALLCLHLLAQDHLLQTSSRADGIEIGHLVARLAAAAGFIGWVDYYSRAFDASEVIVRVAPAKPQALPEEPPDLLSHLAAILAGRPVSAYPDLRQVCAISQVDHRDPYGPDSIPTRLTNQIIALYEALALSTSPNSAARTRACAHKMAMEYGWTWESLQRLMPHVLLPLREAIRSCQLDPPDDWPAAAYELALRPDLARQKGAPARPDPAPSRAAPAGRTKGLRLLASQDQIASADPASDRELGKIAPATRFNEDRRLEEVSRMLCFDKHCTVSAGDRTLEQLTPTVQQSVLMTLSQRTMSLPVGAGIFHYRQTEGSDTDEIKIAAINTSARILPMASPVNLAEKEPRDPTSSAVPDRLEWPEFHTGVAAALQHNHGLDRLDNSKLNFNRPASLDARHAGLLFGLGLSGHLDTMSSSQAYEYLKAKHDPTSVGILLGLAVSYLGTGDPTVTSVISIHLPALHPPQSSVLNVSGMTQAAAAVALGIVHFASGHRTFSNVLLSELCGMKVTNIEDGSACREAYALSAGFAFGMIMLGRGGRVAENAAGELDHLRIFRSLILGESNHSLPGTHQADAAVDINITSPAATVAVALMYLRSERKDVAALLAIPDTTRGLEYVRPDLLLLRVVGRNLVLWSQVAPTKVWVEAQVPSVLCEAPGTRSAPTTDLEVSRWHVIAGACFAIGLRFAGTASAEGHATLIHYLDRLTRASYSKAPTIQSRIRRSALRNCLSVVSLSLAMIMAGTGEVNVLRRLRVAHGLFSEGVTYGSHLASHMALGLLFLGGGRYTLGNSDAAIAALLLSLYPALPATSVENRAHLQAYRHLWVLAVEPRYLEARDVDTNEPVFLPVRLRLKDDSASGTASGARVKQLVAPTLIPDLDTIHSIQSDSPRYLPFSLPLAEDATARRDFMRSGVLYVKRRTGHLSYAEDPRGIRSVFTRSKSEAGSTVFDLGETSSLLASSASNLRDFVRAFSSDVEALSATNCLSSSPDQHRPPTALESFSSSVLLEGLTRDKSDIAGVYHALYSAAKTLASSTITDGAFSGPPSSGLRLGEMRFLLDFYQSGSYKRLFGKVTSTSTSSKATAHHSKPNVTSSVREPLINPAFTVHLSTVLAAIGERGLKRSIDDGSLPSYLCNDAADLPRHLAIAVRHLRLPSRTALQVLRNLVMAIKAEQDLDVHGVEMVLRKLAAAMADEKGQGSVWTSAATEAMARAWCSS